MPLLYVSDFSEEPGGIFMQAFLLEKCFSVGFPPTSLASFVWSVFPGSLIFPWPLNFVVTQGLPYFSLGA